jgi:hypothetical protein
MLARGGNTTLIIATLLPRQSYERNHRSKPARNAARVSAIYLDQPPARQASFPAPVCCPARSASACC